MDGLCHVLVIQYVCNYRRIYVPNFGEFYAEMSSLGNEKYMSMAPPSPLSLIFCGELWNSLPLASQDSMTYILPIDVVKPRYNKEANKDYGYLVVDVCYLINLHSSQ